MKINYAIFAALSFAFLFCFTESYAAGKCVHSDGSRGVFCPGKIQSQCEFFADTCKWEVEAVQASASAGQVWVKTPASCSTQSDPVHTSFCKSKGETTCKQHSSVCKWNDEQTTLQPIGPVSVTPYIQDLFAKKSEPIAEQESTIKILPKADSNSDRSIVSINLGHLAGYSVGGMILGGGNFAFPIHADWLESPSKESSLSMGVIARFDNNSTFQNYKEFGFLVGTSQSFFQKKSSQWRADFRAGFSSVSANAVSPEVIDFDYITGGVKPYRSLQGLLQGKVNYHWDIVDRVVHAQIGTGVLISAPLLSTFPVGLNAFGMMSYRLMPQIDFSLGLYL